jgi:hypothetical protein
VLTSWSSEPTAASRNCNASWQAGRNSSRTRLISDTQSRDPAEPNHPPVLVPRTPGTTIPDSTTAHGSPVLLSTKNPSASGPRWAIRQGIAIHALRRIGIKNTADSTHDYPPIHLRSFSSRIKFRSADTRSRDCSSTTCSGLKSSAQLSRQNSPPQQLTIFPQVSTRRPPASE